MQAVATKRVSAALCTAKADQIDADIQARARAQGAGVVA
jgi:hypothetical protein